jgi:hypothetical protein
MWGTKASPKEELKQLVLSGGLGLPVDTAKRVGTQDKLAQVLRCLSVVLHPTVGSEARELTGWTLTFKWMGWHLSFVSCPWPCWLIPIMRRCGWVYACMVPEVLSWLCNKIFKNTFLMLEGFGFRRKLWRQHTVPTEPPPRSLVASVSYGEFVISNEPTSMRYH